MATYTVHLGFTPGANLSTRFGNKKLTVVAVVLSPEIKSQ